VEIRETDTVLEPGKRSLIHLMRNGCLMHQAVSQVTKSWIDR
jgi:hypothetical protein